MGKAPDHDVKQELRSVEKEVDLLRERTQSLVSEIERRIHERVSHVRSTVDKVKHAVDVKAQARAHPRVAAGIGAGAVVAIGLGIWLGVARSHRRRQLIPRMQRKAIALRQFLIDPELHLQKKEPIGRRVVAAVLATAATVLVRALAQRLVDQMRQPKRLAAPSLLPPMAGIPIT
jgi:ElaB/YqjD/DUF883 family membrane-anchored ribosome-binding protein